MAFFASVFDEASNYADDFRCPANPGCSGVGGGGGGSRRRCTGDGSHVGVVNRDSGDVGGGGGGSGGGGGGDNSVELRLGRLLPLIVTYICMFIAATAQVFIVKLRKVNLHVKVVQDAGIGWNFGFVG